MLRDPTLRRLLRVPNHRGDPIPHDALLGRYEGCTIQFQSAAAIFSLRLHAENPGLRFGATGLKQIVGLILQMSLPPIGWQEESISTGKREALA
jgi:hypothetical protein